MDALVTVKSVGYGGLRVARRYITRPVLADLFQIKSPVLADQEGDEVVVNDKGEYQAVDPSIEYTVVDEADISGEGDEPNITYMDAGRLESMRASRMNFIKTNYRVLHPEIFTLRDSWLDPVFVQAVQDFKQKGDKEALMKALKRETATGIFSLHLFTIEFCKLLLEEVENFQASGLPLHRPNSMNRYGLILDEIGFYPLFDKLREEYIVPLSSALYPQYGGASLDSHHAFIVQYKMAEDRKLDFHFDDAEVTINVCLGREFTGGSVWFAGLVEQPETHDESYEYGFQPGLTLLHAGHHRHGAKNILSGERFNLVVWFRSASHRAETAPPPEQEHKHDHTHTHGDEQKK